MLPYARLIATLRPFITTPSRLPDIPSSLLEMTPGDRADNRTRALGHFQGIGQEEVARMYRLWKEVQEQRKQQ